MLPKQLAIVGAGQLGCGIGDLSCRHAFERVYLADACPEALDRAIKNITKSLKKSVNKGLLTDEDANAALSRLQTTTHLEELHEADFVVEAVPEDELLKKSIFSSLDMICKPDAILSSNTSSISITRLGAATRRPEKVIGMHFMNPPLLMKLLEVIGGKATDQETFDRAQALALQLNKTVCFSADRPGFIINRLLMPMVNEAFFTLMEGVASADDIDLGMKLGTNIPMGPLALADFIGLDTCLNIMKVLHSGLGEDKYRPCPLLVQYVDAGWHGVKSGRGVYLYPDGGKHSSPIAGAPLR